LSQPLTPATRPAQCSLPLAIRRQTTSAAALLATRLPAVSHFVVRLRSYLPFLSLLLYREKHFGDNLNWNT